MTRRTRNLLVGGGVLLLVAWGLRSALMRPATPAAAVQGSGDPERGSASGQARRRARFASRLRGPAAAAAVPPLELWRLLPRRDVVPLTGRNVFVFAPTREELAAIREAQEAERRAAWVQAHPPKPPVLSPEEQEAQRLAEEQRQRLEAERQAAEQRRLACTATGFKYIGSFGRPGAEIAVISDGTNLHNVRVGEAVGGGRRFVLKSIGLESVDLDCMQYSGEPLQRLPIAGDETTGRSGEANGK